MEGASLCHLRSQRTGKPFQSVFNKSSTFARKNRSPPHTLLVLLRNQLLAYGHSCCLQTLTCQQPHSLPDRQESTEQNHLVVMGSFLSREGTTVSLSAGSFTHELTGPRPWANLYLSRKWPAAPGTLSCVLSVGPGVGHRAVRLLSDIAGMFPGAKV